MRIIIIGAGQVGFHIASRLAMEKKDVVVVDKDPEALRQVFESLDVQTVQGCGSSPVILEKSGIKGADILLAVTDSDETNLVATFFANLLSPTTVKLVRIRSEEYLSYQDILTQEPYGIDVIINDRIGIFIGSVLSAIVGYVTLRIALANDKINPFDKVSWAFKISGYLPVTEIRAPGK